MLQRDRDIVAHIIRYCERVEEYLRKMDLPMLKQSCQAYLTEESTEAE